MPDGRDDDVLDAEQARRFAWRIEAPPEDASAAPAPADVEPVPPRPPSPEVDPELGRAIGALRSQIERVWAMSPAK